MTFESRGKILIGAALLLLVPGVANAQEEHQLSVRNDSGHMVTCAVRKSGSSAKDDFTIKAGQVWAESYSGSKARVLLCEGASSNWQPLDPDRPYHLVKAGDDRIVAQPLASR